jgi:hypothetical protein
MWLLFNHMLIYLLIVGEKPVHLLTISLLCLMAFLNRNFSIIIKTAARLFLFSKAENQKKPLSVMR